MGISATEDLVTVERPDGAGPLVLVCDHASNAVPAGFAALDVPSEVMETHVAWDPGALQVAQLLAAATDSPLVYPRATRLLLDCNRTPDAPGSIVARSEDTEVPGNRDLALEERLARVRRIYTPFHAAIDAVIDRRLARRQPTAVVAIHSFTPVYHGKPRPWDVGVLHDRDRGLADLLLQRLRADGDVVVGDNEPYAPRDGVYHTLARHAEARGLPSVMIEIRNDRLADRAGQAGWGDRLARHLVQA
ncbi:MAG: N-formylglutamate amidohydrolase [Alphaproteobacteria bacterium]|jgi:predicted N-formylglutamate amidohydrolase|nr:N-formylglutamate amidohydrolase [Alphaproteobacteria bacterium]